MSEEWRMESEEWRMENGEQKNGNWLARSE
jgi:hypothetical protein